LAELTDAANIHEAGGLVRSEVSRDPGQSSDGRSVICELLTTRGA
jgi:hypothetical protein